MDAVFYGIADSLQPLFVFVAKLGNIPNALFVVCGFIAFTAWTRRLIIFKRQGDNE